MWYESEREAVFPYHRHERVRIYGLLRSLARRLLVPRPSCNIVLHYVPGDPVTLTVRLDPQLEELLDSYCRKRRQTKTEVLTRLLQDHLATASDGGKKPYQLAREFGLIGAFASGRRDASENRKRYLREKLRAKHSR